MRRTTYLPAILVSLWPFAACKEDPFNPPELSSSADHGEESGATGPASEGGGTANDDAADAGPASEGGGTANDDAADAGGACCMVSQQLLCGCDNCPDHDNCQGGVDESSGGDGGYQCETASYECNGWVAGLYERIGDPNNVQFDNDSNPHPDVVAIEEQPGVGAALCVSFSLCLDYIGDNDQDLDAVLLDVCRDHCENTMSWEWPEWLDAGEQYYPWTGDTACVFAPDGYNGTIPNGDAPNTGDGVYGGTTVTGHPTSTPKLDCTYTVDGTEVHYIENTSAPHPDQVIFRGAGTCENGVCEEMLCTGWKPSDWISSSYDARTRTYTVSMADALLQELIDGGWTAAMGCDDGRWTRSQTGGPTTETWKMSGIFSGDFLFQLGFRTNDKEIRVRDTAGSTWYKLYGYSNGLSWVEGYTAIINAYVALSTKPTLTFEFKRQSVSGSWVTHTIKLTRT